MSLNKRGDVNWFVVSIILAVATLIVFLLIFAFFPWRQTMDRTACHESIIVKASLPETTLIDFKEMVSVRCQSRHICVTAKSAGKGECDELGKDFETIRLSASSVKDVEARKLQMCQQINMFLAREMADCWNMFGEGKLQIFSRGWDIAASKSTGIICDKIQFDNSIILGVDKKENTADDMKSVSSFMYYMATHKVPNQNISYMDYIRNTPEGDSAASLYGSIVNPSVQGGANVEPFASDTVQKSDMVYLKGVKSIFYLETRASGIGKVVGQAAGFALAFYGVGKVAKAGYMAFGVAETAATVGAAKYGFVGATFGSGVLTQPTDGFFQWITGWTGKEPYVGGLIFTDYSDEGFKDFKIGGFVSN